ncbi:MAG: response regulator [Proteobacteria bacterium]|nr:response regulator [Pseudomonadota bacterium]
MGWLFVIFVFLAPCSPARAVAPSVLFQPNTESYELDLHLDLLEDPSGDLNFADITAPASENRFTTNTTKKPNWGFTSSVFWARFTPGNQFDPDQEWLLQLNYPLLNTVEVYLPDGSGGYLMKQIGTSLPFQAREIKNRHLLVSLSQTALSGPPIYLKIRSQSTMSLPMTIWSARAFIKADQNELLFQGIYYGIILVIAIYSLLLLISLRDISYFYHLLFIVNFGIFQLIMNGTAYEYLWPTQVWWNSHSLPIFICLSCVGTTLFTRKFLETEQSTPLLDRILLLVAALSLSACLIPFATSYAFAIKVAAILALVSICSIILTGSLCLARGYRPARYFMAAWSMFCLGIIILVLRAFGFLSNDAVYFYEPQIGSALTVILLALALADRINIMSGKAFEAQSRYRSIFEHATEGIIRITPEGKLTMVNPALASMFGYSSPQEVLEADLDLDQVYVDPAQRATLREQLFHEGVVKNFETEMYHKDGGIIPVTVNIAAILDPHGTIVHMEGIITDISERKKNEEMRLAKEAAIYANQAKSRFLAAMSHEIRTPMNGVIGFTNMLLNMEVQPNRRRYLELIKDSADRLLKIINEILDFSRIEAGKVQLEETTFLLGETLTPPLELLSLKARGKGLSLRWDIPTTMPGLTGDPARLTQVLINLVDNAIKFTKAGEVVLKIFEETRHHDQLTLHFTVTDTGIGLDEQQIHQIFEAFTQADGTHARHYGGTGLGLTISAELVKLMKGNIWVERMVDEQGNPTGSTFHFTVTMASSTGHDDQVTAHPQIHPPHSDLNLRILLADDESINRILVVEILHQFGWETTEVTSGREVLTELTQNTYDLLLLDLEMPEMDGFETTRIIRSREAGSAVHLPILALTAHAIGGYQERCLTAGMNGYLSKPFDPEELREKILMIINTQVVHDASASKPK